MGLKGEMLHLPDRNGLQDLVKTQSVKTKIILGTKTARGGRESQADRQGRACQVVLTLSELCRRSKGIGSR